MAGERIEVVVRLDEETMRSLEILADAAGVKVDVLAGTAIIDWIEFAETELDDQGA
jgi:predicted transcriptional regulator